MFSIMLTFRLFSAVIAALCAVTAVGAQTGAPPAAASSGIIFVDVTPDSITTIKTAQNLITRIALSREAKQAICGDLFDPASNAGSFVITRDGNDVFIKPVVAKGQTNLFIKTDQETYNFDLVVVPPPQAYRVVNVNVPPYEAQLQARRDAAEREIEQERTQMATDMEQQLTARRQELEQKAADSLAAEQRKLRADADRRAADLAVRRFTDGILQGFTTVALRERRGQLEQVEVAVDDAAYVFEGRLYVRYRITNRGSRELTLSEPRLLVQGGEKDRPVTAMIFTSRGDYKVPAGQTAAGVAVFERPALVAGERIVLVVRAGGDRMVQLRLLEQT